MAPYLKTAVATLWWFLTMPWFIFVVSPLATVSSARSMSVGLALFTAIAVHVWPTRTPGWRTVLLAWFLCGFTGAFLQQAGAGHYALTGATLVGFAVVLLRVNQNGRKVWRLVRQWRDLH